MTDPRSDWRDDAECARADIYNPDDWFEFPFDALNICRTRCPVLDECREWALTVSPAPSGIVGGLAENERRRIRRNRKKAEKKADNTKESAA